MSEKQIKGIALICDASGTIVKVAKDELNLSQTIEKDKLFITFFSANSIAKALDFITTLKKDGAVFNWEMNVDTDSEPIALHFAGGKFDDLLLIVASKSRNGLQKYLEEMMRINNEQLNTLRKTLKGKSLGSPVDQIDGQNNEEALYDELSRLNNELVNMQRELAKKNNELENLNQLKNRFIGMAAHDIRNPLGLIINLSEFLEEDIESLSEEQVEFITKIKEVSTFLLQLVDDLLDLTNIESGKLNLEKRPQNVLSLIESNVKLNRVMAEKKRIKINYKPEISDVELNIDRAKIEQVLNNLISNAVKYSYPRSEIEVSVRKDKDNLIVSVRDQGQGIPQAEIDKLFQPYQKTTVRTTEGEKSSGLGLYIARRIIEGHHGQIKAESEKGKGSIFWFALPLEAGNG